MPARRMKESASAKLFGKMSLYEAWGLAVSFFAVSFVFAYDFERPFSTFGVLPKAMAAVAITMAVHEFVQRKVAKRFGCSAAYEMWLPGVVFSLLMVLVGIKLIIVGGTAVAAYKFSRWGMRDRHASFEEVGIISMSGPVANLVLATVFKAFAGPAGWSAAAGYLSDINTWFAVYSLIPLKQLDGGGLFMWSHVYWILIMIWAALLLTPFGIFSGVFTFL
ncbi:MAG: hypothetical protein ABIA12_01760 [Candidatus Aenigmatarchaeota archaeon]